MHTRPEDAQQESGGSPLPLHLNQLTPGIDLQGASLGWYINGGSLSGKNASGNSSAKKVFNER
jgi:hypothetical protein